VRKSELNVNSAHVRLQHDSDATVKMLKCKIADDGLLIAVKIKKPIEGALLDPSFLVTKYKREQYGFDEQNPLYVALHSLKRAYMEDKEYFSEKVVNRRQGVLLRESRQCPATVCLRQARILRPGKLRGGC
jgi:hypothetical protein